MFLDIDKKLLSIFLNYKAYIHFSNTLILYFRVARKLVSLEEQAQESRPWFLHSLESLNQQMVV